VCGDRRPPDADTFAHRAQRDADALADRADADPDGDTEPAARTVARVESHTRALADRAVPDLGSSAHRHEPDAGAQARCGDLDRAAHSDATSAVDADGPGPRRSEPAAGAAPAGADRSPFGARSGARQAGRRGIDVDRRYLFDGGARRRVRQARQGRDEQRRRDATRL
jgi:hypothetical protein